MTFVSSKNSFVTVFVSPEEIRIFAVWRDFREHFRERSFPGSAECLFSESQSVFRFGASSIFWQLVVSEI